MSSTPPSSTQREAPTPLGGGPAGGSAGGAPSRNFWIWILAALLVNYALVKYMFPDQGAPPMIPYTVFKEEVARGNVKAIHGKGEQINGRFINEVTYTPSVVDSAKKASPALHLTEFTTIVPSFADPGLEELLEAHQVEILVDPIAEEKSPFWSILSLIGMR